MRRSFTVPLNDDPIVTESRDDEFPGLDSEVYSGRTPIIIDDEIDPEGECDNHPCGHIPLRGVCLACGKRVAP